MKIVYGNDSDKMSVMDFERLMAMDTYDSGDDTNAVDATHDGILDSDHGEFDINSVDELLTVLAGKPDSSRTSPRTASSSTTTPNGKTYSDGIVDIPGGQFEMGSVNGDSDEHKSDGTTVKVTMSGFKLSKSEVTVGQYKAYLATTGDPQYSKLPDYPENKKGDDFPVVGLKYGEKQAFCQYYGGTLPTAAQIEYASKGPSHTDGYGTPFDKAAIYRNGFKTTAEVCGSNDERANGYGVCDLAGNVWETTLDQYDEDFYDRMATRDPSNPLTDSASQYVELRGGSWLNYDWGSRSAFRNFDFAVYRSNDVGFRCAWPSPQD